MEAKAITHGNPRIDFVALGFINSKNAPAIAKTQSR
jgi:hypothetical protein